MKSEMWHAMKVEEVMDALKTSPEGLSQDEVKRRLEEFGPNELKKEKGKSPIKLLIEQFASILIIILLIATALSMVVGEIWDATVILAIVVACAVLGFTQEYKAEKALEALKKMTAPTAIVLREGKELEIQTSEIVPGDITILHTGDKVSADGRLIEAVNLQTDEAPLTGESTPVDKAVMPLPEATAVSDRKDVVFTGTAVTYGRGKAVVTSTGMNTEFGKIAKMVQVTEEEQTPLERRMAEVGKWLGIFSVAVCAIVAVLGILIRGTHPLDMILWGISLAVAAVPEALPAVVTGALAVGMYRMARENAVVRRLPAVETLGCTSVICSDKTGTMTKGEMTVRKIYVNGQTVKVIGVGYEPKGEFYNNGDKLGVADEKELNLLLRIGALCNDSKLEQKNGQWGIRGDPTEGAMVVAAAKAGLWKQELEKEKPRVGEVPFSSERKRMTTVHPMSNDLNVAYMKGAPEIVLERCTKIYKDGKVRNLTDEDRKKLLTVNECMAKEALRNLAVAYRELPKSLTSFTEAIPEKQFTFVGIMGMIDPPREEVKEALKLCKKAGIKSVMITGDHKLTAVAVAKELKLIDKENPSNVLTGTELDELNDEEFEKIVDNVTIYARVSPEHKVRILKALKKKGSICAMTGDGVNDAPALKMADMGVAMGITGTEVTKEASDMVLTDDNFATIVGAVKEGREIYGNIKKYLAYLLRCNIMEILVMFIVMMMCPPPQFDVPTGVLPPAIALTTIQILWVNLTTDGLPAIALGVDPGDPDLMERKPRNPEESVFTKDVKIYLTTVPILMTVLLLVGYFYYQPWLGKNQLLEARTQLFTAMVFMELVNALCARSLKHTVFKVGVFKNKFLWLAILSSAGLQFLVLYTPLNSLFEVTYPDMFDWALTIGFTAFTFFAIELGKYLGSKKSRT
ncbi:MAG: cation-translocating P-type ATPase [Thermoproteota archaeon]|nr:cation-translocating P-type ATPase [Thermoproteota archaeon]